MQAPSTVEAEPTVTASPEPSTEETPASTEEFERVANPYADSFLANKDMAAWLQIPGTNIDYPVMWTPEDETIISTVLLTAAKIKTAVCSLTMRAV